MDYTSIESMRQALSALGGLAALATLPGSLELGLLTTAAALDPWLRRRPRRHRVSLRHLAVVVPAHNEAAGIASCVHSLRACRWPDIEVEIVVVADNCDDSTAERARAAGARVLERRDLEKRGKGFALESAFRRLLEEGVDAVAVVDADSVVSSNFLEVLVETLRDGADAVQVAYGVRNRDDAVRTRLMRLALLAFNRLRLQGREALGLSVGITGNGFALTRRLLLSVPYAATSVVEDVEFHLRLVREGWRVRFAPTAEVSAEMPVDGGAAASQRARWEGGRLRMWAEHAGPLLRDVVHGKGRCLEPLLDLLLLPLAWHCVLLATALGAAPASFQIYAASALGLVAWHVLVAVRRGGGGWRDVAVLIWAPAYIVWKITMLPRIVRGASRKSLWVRTPRRSAEVLG